MNDDIRRKIGEVLQDFRDGLLDGVDEGVDRILEITRPRPNLGHSIGTNPPRRPSSSVATFDPD